MLAFMSKIAHHGYRSTAWHQSSASEYRATGEGERCGAKLLPPPKDAHRFAILDRCPVKRGPSCVGDSITRLGNTSRGFSSSDRRAMLIILLAGSFCGVDMTSSRFDEPVEAEQAANKGVQESLVDRTLALLSGFCNDDLPAFAPALSPLLASSKFDWAPWFGCVHAELVPLREKTLLGACDSRPHA